VCQLGVKPYLTLKLAKTTSQALVPGRTRGAGARSSLRVTLCLFDSVVEAYYDFTLESPRPYRVYRVFPMKFPSFPSLLKTVTLGAALIASSHAAHATDYVWSGDDSTQPTDWFSPENWEAEGSTEPLLALKTTTSRLSLSVNTAILRPSGVPGPGDNATIGAGSNVAINKPLTIGSLTVEKGGVLQGSGAVSVLSSLVLDGARLQGEGKVSLSPDATVKIAGAGSNNIIGKAIDNLGNLVWESGRVTLLKDFRNKGTFYLGCDGALSTQAVAEGQAKPVFYNEGTIVKAVSTGQSLLGANVVNSGDIYVRSGQLNLGPEFSQTGGSLNLDGGDVASSGTIQIDGGVVQGIGQMNGNVVNDGGTFKPGHSPGFIYIFGNYTQTSNGSLDLEIGGMDPGVEYDQMLIYGNATLGGSLNLVRWNNYVPEQGYGFYLISCYSVASDFNNFTGLCPVGQYHYRIVRGSTDYIATVRIDNTPPALVITQPVANTSYNSITSVKGTTNDTGLGSGVEKVTCRLYRYANGSTPAGYWSSGSTWTTGYGTANEKLCTGTTNWSLALPSLANGQYYVKVTARDNVGNVVTSNNIVFNKVSSGGATASMVAPTSDSAILAHLLPEHSEAGKNS
jgi:hypothetical protein